jgi:hypothetical protein
MRRRLGRSGYVETIYVAFVGLEFIERFYDGLSEWGWVYDTGWVILLYGKELYECNVWSISEPNGWQVVWICFRLFGGFFLVLILNPYIANPSSSLASSTTVLI